MISVRIWIVRSHGLVGWAASSGYEVGEVVAEVGLGGRHWKLLRVLSDPSVSVVVVEHRDRLARFGVEHLEAALGAQGRRIVTATEHGEEVGWLDG